MTGMHKAHHRHDDIARAHGTDQQDYFPGTEEDDNYNGLAGEDTISGVGGNDTLYGGGDGDWIDGGPGRDLIYGDGKAGNTLSKGRDTINGGTGRDTLYGGALSDTFVFNTGNGKDAIGDFQLTGKQQDVIDLRGVESVHNFHQLMQFAHESAAGVHINFSHRDVLTIDFAKLEDLDKSLFLFD